MINHASISEQERLGKENNSPDPKESASHAIPSTLKSAGTAQKEHHGEATQGDSKASGSRSLLIITLVAREN